MPSTGPYRVTDRRIAGLSVLAAFALLPLCGCGPQGAGSRDAPWLPEGCRWVREPAQDCPAGEARAYRKWVERNGPVTLRHEASGIELDWVPGGPFRMGSDDGGRDELPVHRVRLSGFWIGRTEVTVGQWRTVMGSVPGQDNDQGDEHPVVDVSWEDCQEFCRRTALALPTEAQWECAARGPEGWTYPWGNAWEASLCRSAETRHGQSRTAPAGSFPGGAAWCGALDMAGNVSEWCRDWYGPRFYRTREARRPNPECARRDSGERVLRGGSWFEYGEYCRSARRARNAPWFQDLDAGFRVARIR